MTDSSLQDRLRNHAKAFDGLLSLIPAKTYYGQDASLEGNKRTKQSKEEAAAARRGKLDPDSELNRNAKEVMDERANNKRKLREMQQQGNEDEENESDGEGHASDSLESIDGIEAEKPGEGMRIKKVSKKQRLQGGDENDESPKSTQRPQKLSRKEEKRAAKRERKAGKKAEKKAKRKEEPVAEKDDTATAETHVPSTAASKKTKKKKEKAPNDDATPSEPQPLPSPPTTLDCQATAEAPLSSQSNLSEPQDDDVKQEIPASSDLKAPSIAFDAEQSIPKPTADALAEATSAPTSASSTTGTASEKCKQIKMPADMTTLRARLAAKIEALRAARKADGPDGKPIRTRQELIEARRAKQAQRKAHKRELRTLAKQEEARKREEALASNSPGVGSPAGVDLDENLSFGRVVFGDGTQASHDLSYVLQKGKRKGPSDAKTALLKVQGQKKRLAELEPDKRADVADKEAWLTARRRVEGDKIRDDEATLKKAVRRKEAAKKKSKAAWRERSQGIEKAQKERQRKRESNIQKRRDDKMLGKAGKKKAAAGKKGKAGRPGFEGSFGVGGRTK
ncbi:ribosome biogenesis protein Rrp14-C [Ophiocordyceps camponoti-floridani]|uniref:Ribosome biogenesis protein Rrp14-C n=1 Tax=Ophiocordyceps camponoti-floridani TaxID=2030778 RepID=A0A8H4VEA1_9HYPO|nr:ribosome biogenesis protein Rrp14-C [Ophiocordyceps camponoti-floridani]